MDKPACLTLARSVIPLLSLAALMLAPLPAPAQEGSVAETISAIVDRLRADAEPGKPIEVTHESIPSLVTDEERQVLATRYWYFDVNVPVVVSVMRHVEQAVVPFWLEGPGWRKTDLKVRNEEYEYEVWQKEFDAGRVGLGINGFDKHRPHYFVSVGPQDKAAKLQLTNLYPDKFPPTEMREGATIYHDWSELVLTEVPESLRGQILLSTIRGRAREAQLIGAFRETPFPSSENPDLIILTWSDDPKTTQTVQWRTAASVKEGVAQYRAAEQKDAPWTDVPAERQVIRDAFVSNDGDVHRFTATLRGLTPDTWYEYRVGTPGGAWSEPASFKTAPSDEDQPFTFLFLSDVHNRPHMEALFKQAAARFPGAVFATISGDLVGTGQYRDDWDQFLAYSSPVARQYPLVPAIGNHDTIDGLGADMYLSVFDLPKNGPKGIAPERAYSVRYGNTLVLVLDCTEPLEPQTPWIEEQLANTDATWKFVVFHFPPYSPDEDYPDIRAEWCTVFDKYHVDFVLAGHVHNYQRTHPIRNGEPMERPEQGTVYLITCSVPWRPQREKPEYAAFVGEWSKPTFVAFTIDGDRLEARAFDEEGNMHDEFTIVKQAEPALAGQEARR
jgi:hypothetical protein